MSEAIARYTVNLGMSVGAVSFELSTGMSAHVSALALRKDILADITSEVAAAIGRVLECPVIVGTGTIVYTVGMDQESTS